MAYSLPRIVSMKSSTESKPVWCLSLIRHSLSSSAFSSSVILDASSTSACTCMCVRARVRGYACVYMRDSSHSASNFDSLSQSLSLSLSVCVCVCGCACAHAYLDTDRQIAPAARTHLLLLLARIIAIHETGGELIHACQHKLAALV